LLDSMIGLSSKTGVSVKMRPTLPDKRLRRASSSLMAGPNLESES
jgi:hypothetical protein